MSHLREIRHRIQGVKKTQQVTRAMKMVAATKLRRCQQALLKMRPYAEYLEDIISALLTDEELPVNPLLAPSTGNQLHVLVMAGDRGLCGGFNTTIFRYADTVIRSHEGPLHVTVFGRKAVEYFMHKQVRIDESYVDLDRLDFLELSRYITEKLIRRYASGEIAQIVIIYSRFHNIMQQQVIGDAVLPLAFDPQSSSRKHLDYIFYPDSALVLDQLLPRYVSWHVYRALRETMASLYGARMTAMDMATRNAGELINRLVLDYNQERQATITRELIEIISGAEALNR
ncbi:ATP synthase F1 subunit gamma [bacterium]|nr:ATP synthase F1 subunit gamma [candidate division CSSED10-310 bacterium]